MMKNYPKEYFKLVNVDEKKLHDKSLKTKQLSYFQDALLRFGKNKYNVIASFILVVFIILSIIVPMLTPKHLYTEVNSMLSLLPPRMPIVSNFGILDGSKFYKNQAVDLTTVSEETGLGYPTEDFNVNYIDLSTLKNEIQTGTYLDPTFTGGTNEIYIASGKTSFSIASKEYISVGGGGQNVYVDINGISGGVLEVYLVKIDATEIEIKVDIATDEITETIVISHTVGDLAVTWGDTRFMDYIGTADEEGINQILIESSKYGLLAFRYVLEGPADSSDEYISLNTIYTTYGDADAEKNKEYTGFPLADFSQISLDSENENGSYNRLNASRLVASFVYEEYAALFDDKEARIGGVEYDRIVSENEGMAETIVVSSTNPKSWVFGEGYPITKVVDYTEVEMDVDGVLQTFRTYEVMLDGEYALGFDEIPYFLFGTDVGGKDLFSLIWLGLRTSLLLGFLAAVTNIFFGVIWGSISGYYGGQTDILMERFTDIWGSFPQITMIAIITVIIGPGFLALYIFMVYDGWIRAAKITRMQFYRYKGREYVLAARTLGASDNRIIFRHILPNALGTIVTSVILSIPMVIFLEVNLSYLGFGIGSGQKLSFGPLELTGTSIGVILADGQEQILAGNLWLIIYPTIIVSILMITFNMFGNALRDALNPQLRGN